MNKKTSLAIACMTMTMLITTGLAPYSAKTAHAHDVQGLLDTVIQGPTAPIPTAHAINTAIREKPCFSSV